YAALGTSALFEAIRSQSLATTALSEQQKKEAVIPANLKPIATRIETVAPPKEEKKEEPKPNEIKNERKSEKVAAAKPVGVTTTAKTTPPATANKVSELKSKYHVIIASLTTHEEAKKSVATFQKKGYKNASIVEGGGRYRLSIANSTEISAAYAKVKELKDSGAFKDAWVLTTE
ncbi:MAG: SPOR domain-containing protein, partial [Phocaeicola sp.]